MRLFRATGAPERRGQRAPAPEVLVAIADPVLAEHARQVVAASGRGLAEASPPFDRRLWRAAGAVVMDEHAARWCAAERLVRDGATALVFAGAVPHAGWQLAVHARAGHVLALPEQERELVRVVGEAVERRVGAGGDSVCGIGAEAALAVLDSARSAGDVVVVDLPRAWGDLQHAVLETADSAVLVMPAELRAIVAGRSLAAVAAGLCANLGAVVRGPSPGGLRAARVAAEAGVPLLASTHYEHSIAVGVERGGLVLRSRSSVLRAAEAVLGCRRAKAVGR